MKDIWLLRITLVIALLLSIVSNTAFADSGQNLFFSTPPSQVEIGERFTLSIKVQSTAQSINAISGVVSFPESLLHVVSVSKDKSIINLWTKEPSVLRNKISFEGIILNPGYQGSGGVVFNVTFEAEKIGTPILNFSEGAVLANDGLGTNVLASLGSANLKIIQGPTFSQYQTVASNGKLPALPVITEYSPLVDPTGQAYLKGKGEPNAITKIVFKDVALKSVGEQFIELLQTKKKRLDEVLVKNDQNGAFQYISPVNLVAGVYNATPFLVDNSANTEKPGLGVQLLVSDSKVVKALVIVINILGLLIPIVGLGVIIYFIPWYSWKRMRVIKKKLGLEEEKIDISGRELERQDKVMEKTVDKL
ncbi:cohesin domain-containing protein [Patescibacteria group bacterium]|nr:cohesin domain-containing protein [Patescibacteria group bacterium]